MKVKDIVELEEKNDSSIFLLKEGIFYRAYDRSLMRFSSKIKKLKVNAKYVKVVKRTIFYGGFPESILDMVHEGCLANKYSWEKCENKIAIRGFDVSKEDYEGWKEEFLKKHEGKNVLVNSEKYCPERTPVVEKFYDLIVWLLPKLANFPKDQRFLLADRIQGLLLDVLGLLIEAVYQKERVGILDVVNIKLDQARYLARIAKDMKYVSVKQYDFLTLGMIEIGRMVGGWRKAALAKA